MFLSKSLMFTISLSILIEKKHKHCNIVKYDSNFLLRGTYYVPFYKMAFKGILHFFGNRLL